MNEDDPIETAEDTAAHDKRFTRMDAANRGWRTLVQAILASLLSFGGVVGADMVLPGFETSPEMVAVGAGIAVLTPVLAYLQRRSGK